MPGNGHLKVYIYTLDKVIFILIWHIIPIIICNFLYLGSGLLNRYPRELNITWPTLGKDPITNQSFLRRMAGSDIIALLKNHTMFKVFERLNAGLKRKQMSRRVSLMYKMDIFKDYSYPQPFPRDKFLRLPDGSPNQAYLMLGTKGTGK